MPLGLAHYLAKNKVKYSDKEAHKLVDELSESFQYFLLKASNQLAKKKDHAKHLNKKLNIAMVYCTSTLTKKMSMT